MGTEQVTPCGISGVPDVVCQCASCNPNFAQELLSDTKFPVLSSAEFQRWHLDYFSNSNNAENYGQAFLNYYDHKPEVRALREGNYIWADRRPWSVQSKLREKGIIE